MTVLWVSSPTVFMITLGFAGLFGDLIFRLRNRISIPLVALCILVLGMIVFPPLSLPVVLQRTLWGTGIIVILAYAFRPSTFPIKLQTRQFALRYIAVVMVLSALWNILSLPSFPGSWLAVFACLAALLAWHES